MNGKIDTFLAGWFGASYKTTVLGALGGMAIVAQDMIERGAKLPSTHPFDGWDWAAFIGKVIVGYIIFKAFHQTKDKAVSNAPVPGPAEQVPTLVVAPLGAPVIANVPVVENKP